MSGGLNRLLGQDRLGFGHKVFAGYLESIDQGYD